MLGAKLCHEGWQLAKVECLVVVHAFARPLHRQRHAAPYPLDDTLDALLNPPGRFRLGHPNWRKGFGNECAFYGTDRPGSEGRVSAVAQRVCPFLTGLRIPVGRVQLRESLGGVLERTAPNGCGTARVTLIAPGLKRLYPVR